MDNADRFDPAPGSAEPVAAGLRRVLAPNPSPMTFRGTNTYILGRGTVAVIDPGPADAGHLDAILAALGPGERVGYIFVTHSHLDHSPLARRLADVTGAPVCGFGHSTAGRSAVMERLAASGEGAGGEGVDTGFAPDLILRHGARIAADTWEIEAVHSPGHFGNHLCFQWQEGLFSGDVVMGWATSLVSPPDGDLGDYMATLEMLLGRADRPFYPGHGAPIANPLARIAWLLSHRRDREGAILGALSRSPATATELTAQIYADTPPALLGAAARNVFAHLIDLTTRNLVFPETAPGFSGRYQLHHRQAARTTPPTAQ